jgi:hypothetical protein
MPEFQFSTAIRKAVPMIIGLASVSGGGKTYSGLLLAAGLAGPNGKVGMLDTENERGSMYADSPGIVQALPNGFTRTSFDPPFTPARYIQAIVAAEKAGINVLVVDSTSHEWEGIGGCCDIAENNKLRGMPNWALAKMEHKKFTNHVLSSPMHIVLCLRARDKVKFVKDKNGKDAIEPIGIQPITEKNLVFELLMSLMLDELTHHAHPIKLPQPLQHLFPKEHLITKADGDAIRNWNETGAVADPHDQLRKRARAAAEEGMARYGEFFEALNNAEKKALRDTTHAENKGVAEKADADRKQAEDIPVEAEPVV